MVQAVTLPEGKVKIAAKKFDFDAAANNWNLVDGCVITVVQDEKHSVRFEGETAKVAADDIEWQIQSSVPVDIANLPLLDLSAVLKRNSVSSLFRLTWFYNVGSFSSSGTALYNRKTNTIKEYNLHSMDLGQAGYLYRYSYNGVTDEIIHKAAKEKGLEGSGPFDFGVLIPYGVVRQ